MSKSSKYLEQGSPSQKSRFDSQQKAKVSHSNTKYDPNPLHLRTSIKDISKPSHGQYYDFRLHLRDPKSVTDKPHDDFTNLTTESRLSSNLVNQNGAENYTTRVQNFDPAALVHHNKKSSQIDVPLDLTHLKPMDTINSFEPHARPKETSFSRISHDLNEFTQNSPSFPNPQFSTNQNEMAEFMTTLEQRFSKLEARVENNESLIHLHDEMQRLKNQEARSSLLQEENLTNQFNVRINTLESKVKLLEEIIQTQKVELNSKLDEFVKRIEVYLQKFVENTGQLANKVESLSRESEDEVKLKENKILNLETTVEKLTKEIRDKLKSMCDTVGDFAKMSENTANSLALEKENYKKLEEDLFKLIWSYKESNTNTEDYQWLVDEISFLKYQQVQMMNIINPNHSRNFSNQES